MKAPPPLFGRLNDYTDDSVSSGIADAIARKGDEERRTAALEQWPLDARFDDSDVTSQVDLSDLAEETR